MQTKGRQEQIGALRQEVDSIHHGTPYPADLVLAWSKVHCANGVAGLLRVAGWCWLQREQHARPGSMRGDLSLIETIALP
jgi:hypothetical protein